MARLTSSLSVRISETLRFHAWYEAATSSAGRSGSGGNRASSASGSSPVRPVRRRLADRGPGEPAKLARLAGSHRPTPGEPDPARGGRPGLGGIDRLDRGGRLGERDVGRRSPPVQAVVAERQPVRPGRDRQLAAALDARPAADLEDVRGVGGELEGHLDLLVHLGVVHDPHALLEHAAGEQALASDAQLLRGEGVLRPHLVGDVPLEARVGELDRPVVVAARGGLEEHRPLAVHAHDRARQAARVGVVQAQPAAVGVDVAERVGEQVQVALLEHLDRAQVGGLDDRPLDRVEEARRLGAGRSRPAACPGGRRRVGGGLSHDLPRSQRHRRRR